MSDHKAPFRLYRQNSSSGDARLEEFQTLLPTLEAWAQQLQLLKVNKIHMGWYYWTFHHLMCLVGPTEELKQTEWQSDALSDD